MRVSQALPWIGSAGLIVLAGCSSIQTNHQAGRPRIRPEPDPAFLLRRVADRVLQDDPAHMPFDWGEGVLMAGMMRAGIALGEPRYIDYVKTWADHWLRAGLAEVLEGSGQKMQGYCGHWGPGRALILLYEQSHRAEYLAMANQIAAYIVTTATRVDDGGLAHWKGNQQLWVDTLYMACPLLARLSKIEHRPALLDDAVLQLDVFARHCRDEKSGLFYHMYDASRQQTVGVLWGRGNGWVALSYVEVLQGLNRSSADYKRLHADFARQIQGVLATQDPQTHLWHTVLDREESYLETSASAMFVCALAEAYRLDLIERSEATRQAICSGWTSLAGKVNERGEVIDVSGGTSPASYAVYAQKPRGRYTWGTGAFLMAAAELCHNN